MPGWYESHLLDQESPGERGRTRRRTEERVDASSRDSCEEKKYVKIIAIARLRETELQLNK